MTQKIEMTKEELNKEYFVRGLVPEWDSKIKDFAKTSQQKRKEAINQVVMMILSGGLYHGCVYVCF